MDMEMVDMLEKAKELSKVMNNENQLENDEKKDNQFENMIKMMKMFKAVSALNNLDKEDESKKEEINNYVQPFDEQFQTPAIKTIKAAIPYLEFPYQKNMGILVKIIELDSLMKRYKTMAVNSQSQNNNWKKGMLLSIKPQMNEEKQKIIEMIIKIMDIKEIMDSLNIQKEVNISE